jgi:hypothetical protein
VHTAEVVEESEEQDGNAPEGLHMQHGNWEFRWDAGRKNTLAFALWILTVGILYFCTKLLTWDASLWDILWPSALTIWGLFGLFPRFSFFRLGCTVFGGYFLVNNLITLNLPLSSELLVPAFLILWGLSLLADALRKKNKAGFQLYHNGKKLNNSSKRSVAEFTTEEDSFSCSGSFCDEQQAVALPLLTYGSASLSFGELQVDLSGVEAVSENCSIDANCSFGELILNIPSKFLVNIQNSTSFGQIDVSGSPSDTPEGIIYLNANVSFGEITVNYI